MTRRLGTLTSTTLRRCGCWGECVPKSGLRLVDAASEACLDECSFFEVLLNSGMVALELHSGRWIFDEVVCGVGFGVARLAALAVGLRGRVLRD